MASRKGISISGRYVVSINYMHFHKFIYTFNSKKLKGRTELYFILKLSGHQTRCFSFGLRRIHPNGLKFEFSSN